MFIEGDTNLKSGQHYVDSLGHPTLHTADATLPFLDEMTCEEVAAWW
jgi:hypothetical protein